MGKTNRGKSDECVFSKHSPLCQSLDQAGVPHEPRWWTVIMSLRGLEYFPSLTMKQRAESQTLLVDLLRDKDFSDRRYAELSQAVHAVITTPYQVKLEAALQETSVLIRDVEGVLGRRAGDVQELEDVTMETVRAGDSPEVMVRKLRNSFKKVISAMEEDADHLRKMASTDALTGLLNRRSFDEALEALTRDVRERGLRPWLFMLDIDHFKRINDTYGHVIGDQALKVVAGKIAQCLADCDCDGCRVYRYGGEEFAVVLPDMESEAARELAEKMRKIVERYRFTVRNANGDILHKGVRFTISIGVIQTDPEWGANTAANLVEAADAALYDAKSGGRNRVSFFEGCFLGVPDEK